MSNLTVVISFFSQTFISLARSKKHMKAGSTNILWLVILITYFSQFGEFTDVNIWSKELDHEEVNAWGNFDKVAPPDLVNWSNATLKIKNLIKENVTPTDIL